MNHTIAVIFFGCLCIGQLPPPRDLTSTTLDRTIKRLESRDVQVRRSAACYLLFMKPPKAIPALLKALSDADAVVRRDAANTFASFGEASKPAIPLLANLLGDKELKVRRAAAGALLELGQLSKEALPALTKASKDDDKLVRIYAGTAVAVLEENREKALRFLLDFATDRDEVVKGEAASAFVYIGVRAISILRDGLKDKSPVVRAWTIGALTAIMQKNSEKAKFPRDAIPLLINAINDENDHVAECAIYAASILGFEAKEAIPAIVKRFKDPDWQLRQYAIMHIERFGHASELAIPALKDALKDEHERVRVAAERALAAIEKAKRRVESRGGAVV
jgi:HEAT repeat protein